MTAEGQPNFANKTLWTEDHFDDSQLLCSHCNRINQDSDQARFIARPIGQSTIQPGNVRARQFA